MERGCPRQPCDVPCPTHSHYFEPKEALPCKLHTFSSIAASLRVGQAVLQSTAELIYNLVVVQQHSQPSIQKSAFLPRARKQKTQASQLDESRSCAWPEPLTAAKGGLRAVVQAEFLPHSCTEGDGNTLPGSSEQLPERVLQK